MFLNSPGISAALALDADSREPSEAKLPRAMAITFEWLIDGCWAAVRARCKEQLWHSERLELVATDRSRSKRLQAHRDSEERPNQKSRLKVHKGPTVHDVQSPETTTHVQLTTKQNAAEAANCKAKPGK